MLEERLCAADEAKQMLAQMELENKRFVEGIEEEYCQPLVFCREEKILPVSGCEYKILEGLEEIEETEAEETDDEVDGADEEAIGVDDSEEDTCKVKVSLSQSIDSIDYLPAGQGEVKAKGRKALSKNWAALCKEIRDKAEVLKSIGEKKNAGSGKVK